MGDAARKVDRLFQVEVLLLANPQGLTQSEIARRLGVNRSTIHRYLPDMTNQFSVYEEDGRLFIDRSAYLFDVKMNIHEATAVYLAARLMASRVDHHNTHAASVMRKLSLATENLSNLVSQNLRYSADYMDGAAKIQDPEYAANLEKLTLAWTDQRKMNITHRLIRTGETYTYKFSPYLIEPYAIGNSIYVIGYREPPGAIRTFKLERIEYVEVTKEIFTIPNYFNAAEYFKNSWGIWLSGGELRKVRLVFSKIVAERVQENQWHPSQETNKLPDGRLEFSVELEETIEIEPWIRSWGPDVEVVEPIKLREKIIQDFQQISALYKIDDEKPSWFIPMAKYDTAEGRVHPLIYHMLDVSQTAQAIFYDGLTQGDRQRYSLALGVSIEEAGACLGFWAALHDIGKAAPGFQSRFSGVREKLIFAGFCFPDQVSDMPHGFISAKVLKAVFDDYHQFNGDDAEQLARVIGGHHGEWPQELQLEKITQVVLGDDAWHKLRTSLVEHLAGVLSPPKHFLFPKEFHNRTAFLVEISGLISVADWIGSMETYFPYRGEKIDLFEYKEYANQQAGKALEELGWKLWQPDGSEKEFNELFPFSPRSNQEESISAGEDISPPTLMILEAPTGIGKTEVALYYAHKWVQRTSGKGIYIAMPTQATSNQMDSRFRSYLAQWYPNHLINSVLAHGQAHLLDSVAGIRISNVGDGEEGKALALSWFQNNKKRRLLAPFGVGTVDQALISILQTKHFFIRLFGLSNKVVIFDEVHAYDTYMSELFKRLLEWLRSIGTSVIILSATLPKKTREDLLAVFSDDDQSLDELSKYPRISFASDNGVKSVQLSKPEESGLSLVWIPSDQLLENISISIQDGGCLAIICNTVKKAQDIYYQIREANLIDDGDLILFHSRFPVYRRNQIEEEVLSKFSKGGDRPKKAIVVATQVIEQSLDLDFDLMVSEVAPIDLLIQRVGRLHRHTENDATRPAGLSIPELILLQPDLEGDKPNFGSSSYVYEEYILQKSFEVLNNKETLQVINETPYLIEFVYGNVYKLEARNDLEKLRRKMLTQWQKEINQASKRIIPPPGSDEIFYTQFLGFEEDRPDIHQAFQAMTRLIPPGVGLICLQQTDSVTSLFNNPDIEVDLTAVPQFSAVKEIVKQVINIHDQRVLSHLVDNPAHELPDTWQKVGWLRHFRIAIFKNGVCELVGNRYKILLDENIGLSIVEEESE